MTPSEAIWREYHERLRAFVGRRVEDRAAADDILQDVFVRMHAALPSLKESARLEGWLFQIARNAVADHYRTRRPSEALPEWLEQPASDPAEEARRELAGCLRPMIDRLPDEYREAVTLAELQSLSQKEVSKRQGISLSGAKSRVQRGREQLKTLLLACCHLEFDRRGGVVDFEPRQGCSGCSPPSCS